MTSLAQDLNRNPMLELILYFDRRRHQRRQLATVCAVCVVAWMAVAPANAHELEDGFVERSVAVIVQPGEATIKYSIGANETTRQQLANSWSGDGEADGEADGDDPFLSAVGDALVNGITVQADGNPIRLELVEVMPTPRHHVEATVVMRLKLPNPVAGADSILLKFHDRNFKTCRSAPSVAEADFETASTNSQDAGGAMDGAFRYALKGSKGVMLNRSTVAPILVRAKRRLVAEIPPDQLDAEQQFSAEVILP